MKHIKLFAAILPGIFATLLFVASCKKKFDNPPAPADPAITPTHTIAQVKALHTTAGAFDVINQDMIIAGTVIANDRSGNLFKQLFIQDQSGAIQLLIDATNLHTSFPVGRKVFVKCRGLCVTDNNNMMQLGLRVVIDQAPSIQGIPPGIMRQYITGGSLNNEVPVKVVTDLNTLTTSMQDPNQGTLIQLDNYEFLSGDTTKTYSDTSSYKNDLNRTIRNCDGANIIIRTSGFANFAGIRLPSGNGRVVALYTVFRTTKQLVLRDTADVQFKGARCSFFEEDFESTTSNANIALNGWKNIAEVGGVNFRGNQFGGTRFAQASAFNAAGNPPVVTTWLITPGINLIGTPSANLSFQTIDGFNNGATLTVLASTNYDGGDNPAAATWTTLVSSTANPTQFAGPTASGFAANWRNSGNISLSAYLGRRVFIAFRYDGANPSAGTRRTTTWQVDNVKVTR